MSFAKPQVGLGAVSLSFHPKLQPSQLLTSCFPVGRFLGCPRNDVSRARFKKGQPLNSTSTSNYPSKRQFAAHLLGHHPCSSSWTLHMPSKMGCLPQNSWTTDCKILLRVSSFGSSARATSPESSPQTPRIRRAREIRGAECLELAKGVLPKNFRLRLEKGKDPLAGPREGFGSQ